MFKKKLLYKDFIIEWLYNQKNYIKESTYANYSNIIYTHLIPGLGDIELKKITNKTLQQFINEKFKSGRLDNKGGLSIKTIKNIGLLLSVSFKSAINDNLLPNISLKFNYAKNTTKNKIIVLSIKEQKQLNNYILGRKDNKSLGILLALYTGLRIGELCSLTWKDIDFKNNILYVNKTTQRIYIKNDINKGQSKLIVDSPKTKYSIREIPLNKEFLSILKEFKTNKDDYILTGSKRIIEPRLYRDYYNRILKKARIKKIKFHSLRHTFATNCIRIGTDIKTVSELLGHSSVKITLDLYVHPETAQKKKCINSLYKEINN